MTMSPSSRGSSDGSANSTGSSSTGDTSENDSTSVTRSMLRCSARMVHAGQDGAERILDPLDVTQGQVAIVKLALGHTLHHQLFNQRRDRLGRMVTARPGRRFDRVGHHQDGALLRLRARPWIAET